MTDVQTSMLIFSAILKSIESLSLNIFHSKKYQVSCTFTQSRTNLLQLSYPAAITLVGLSTKRCQPTVMLEPACCYHTSLRTWHQSASASQSKGPSTFQGAVSLQFKEALALTKDQVYMLHT